VQPCRQHNNDDEDVNGKLKFTIPKFLCTHDPKAYLFWQQQVDRIFCVHNYNEKMVSMASTEFQEYESIWCEQVQVTHEYNGDEPIATWDEMKDVMHQCIVPPH
jgi:hypothetical protein